MGGMSAAFLLLASTGAIHHDAAQAIQQHRLRVVGVCPRVLTSVSPENSAENSRRSETQPVTLGPLAEHWARSLQTALADTSRSRGFRLVDITTMEAAIGAATPSQLRQPEFLKSLRRQTGLDALVVVSAKPLGPRKFQQTVELRAVPSGEVLFTQYETNFRTISDAAYAGESWELRRWEAGSDGLWKLAPRLMRLRGNDVYGLGPVFEQMQYASLVRKHEHPLSQDDLPLGFRVVVYQQETTNRNGQLITERVKQTRPLQKIGGEYYVALEPGEEYAIDLWNTSPKEAYALLYVDGVNTINSKLQHPSAVADHEVWWLKNGREHAVIRGWLEHDGVKQVTRNFRVVPTAESVAGGPGILDRVGCITCIFYTKGIAGLPQPDRIVARGAPTTFGTGGGAAREDNLDVDNTATKRGLVLAAMTVHYRTSAQIRQLKAQELAAVRPPIPGEDKTPIGKPMPRPGSENPATKPAVPDETVPFPGTRTNSSKRQEQGNGSKDETQRFPGTSPRTGSKNSSAGETVLFPG